MKGYIAEHCLLMMLEIWRKVTDNKAFEALLTELSKALDCLSYDLLMDKLHAYGLDLASLNLSRHYLANRKQRTKVDSFYSSWGTILSVLPQGSILGPLLLHTFMCDILFIMKKTYFTGYADDNTPYVVRDNAKDVIKILEKFSKTLIK